MADRFLDTLHSMRETADQWLDRLLPSPTVEPATVHRAMRHSVFAGGKRLRAILYAASAEALGCDRPERWAGAGAMEMIHTYSLIHDDLPAMDDDDFRRGVPTCHKVFGEAAAILAGDALLTLAFEVLASWPSDPASAGARCRVVQEAAQAAGTPSGMVAGQVLDMEAPGREQTEALLKEIHKRKTGALIRGCVRCGAILAGASAAELDALTRYAEWLGLSFQITDDILDATSTLEAMGKTPGKDARQGKLTYPALHGLDRSRALAEESTAQALQALNALPCPGRAAFLGDLARHLSRRQS